MSDRRDGGEEENKENEPALTGAPSDADLPQCEAGDEGGSSVEDGDLEITPEQLSEQLFQAWQNELHAPRLLPHKEYTVDLMIELLEAMEDNFNNCEDKRALKVTLHKVEVMRLSYVVHDYIRKRLRKIEDNVEVLQNEHEERAKTNAPSLLSESELAFSARYEKMKRQLMETCFLDHIPPALQQTPAAELDMSSERVIAQVLSNETEQATVPDMTDLKSDRTVQMPPGSVHLIHYPSIAHLLEADKRHMGRTIFMNYDTMHALRQSVNGVGIAPRDCRGAWKRCNFNRKKHYMSLSQSMVHQFPSEDEYTRSGQRQTV